MLIPLIQEYMEGWEKHSHVWQTNSKAAGLTSETVCSLVLQLSHQRLVVKIQNLSAPDVWIWAQTQPFEAIWKQKELRFQPSQPANLKSVNIYIALWGTKFQILICSSACNKLPSTSTWYHPQTRKDEDTTAINNIERMFPNSQQEYSQSCLINSIWIACSK